MTQVTLRQIFISVGIFIGAALLAFQVRAFDSTQRTLLTATQSTSK